MRYYNRKIANNSKVEFVMISGDTDKDRETAWAKKVKFPFPVVTARKQRNLLVNKYGSGGYPHFVLIDKNGKVLARGTSMEQCKAKIKQL